MENIGKTYLRLPRKISDGMYSPDRATRQKYRLYGALMVLAFYTPGKAKAGRIWVNCKIGQLVTNYKHLEEITDIPYSTLRNLMSEAEKEGFIKITPISGQLFIRIPDYKAMTKDFIRTDATPAYIKPRSTPPASIPDLSIDPETLERNRRTLMEKLQRKNKNKNNNNPINNINN